MPGRFAPDQVAEITGIGTDKKLLMANSIKVDSLARLMIRKGLITKNEFFDMLEEVQAEYKAKSND